MQKLKAPHGFTDVSFGGQHFKVDADGVVEVPFEAVLSLFQFGFTALAEEVSELVEQALASTDAKDTASHAASDPTPDASPSAAASTPAV